MSCSPQIDTTTSGVTTINSPDSDATFDVTVNSFKYRFLVVAGTMIDVTGGLSQETAIDFNGDALTRLRGFGNGALRVFFWGLLMPDTGTHTVTITTTPTTNTRRLVFGAYSLYNVDQVTPFGARTNASGTSSSPSVAATAKRGQLVLDILGGVDEPPPASPPTATVGAGQTETWNLNQGASARGIRGCSSRELASSTGTVTMSWSFSKTADWAMIHMPIIPHRPRRRNRQGRGL